MALSNDSPSATAILMSLLAFLSFYFYGHQVQVVEPKTSAVKALISTSRNLIGTKEGVMHIDATMMLCSIQVSSCLPIYSCLSVQLPTQAKRRILILLRQTCTTDEWAMYIRSVKHIIMAESLRSADRDSDFQISVDWASYHESLGYFSVSHRSRGGPKHPTGNFCAAVILYLELLRYSADF